MRRFSVLTLVLFLLIGCAPKTKPQNSPMPKPEMTPPTEATPTPVIQSTPTSTPAIESEIEVILKSVSTGRNQVIDNQYRVTAGDDRIRTGSWVTLTNCVGSEYVSLKVQYQSAYRNEFHEWIIDDYQIEVLDHSIAGLKSLSETDFDHIYPLINRFPCLLYTSSLRDADDRQDLGRLSIRRGECGAGSVSQAGQQPDFQSFLTFGYQSDARCV